MWTIGIVQYGKLHFSVEENCHLPVLFLLLEGIMISKLYILLECSQHVSTHGAALMVEHFHSSADWSAFTSSLLAAPECFEGMTVCTTMFTPFTRL